MLHLARSLWSRPVLFGALALPMLLAGCGGGDGSPNESVDDQSAQLVHENGNDKLAFDFFRAKGLTPVQAAGIVGNLDQESGMSPTISQYGGGPGRGIAQWSAGGRWDSSHHDNAVWYAAKEGKSVHSLDLQLEFIWYELTTFGYGYSELRSAKHVASAEGAFQDLFEICGQCDASTRLAHADAALADFGSDGVKPPGPPTPLPSKPASCGHFEPGQGLVAGESYESCDHRFTLAMQTDGDLVLYRGDAGAMWTTHTHGTDGHVAVMQHDGNFVVYGKHSNPLWASDTYHHAGASLDVQEDGNLVVQEPNKSVLWASGSTLPAAPPAPAGCGAVAPGHGLTAGTSVLSCDGHHELAMQTDGNLVLYRDGKSATWATGTNGKNGFNAVMQDDGNFVLYDTHHHALWASGTYGHASADLAVQDDGNLVVYEGSKALWASHTNGK